MSYIPELRGSLVKAAERQALQAAPAHAHRAEHRRPLAGIGLMLASATAIFVAGLALVLAGHRPSPSVRAGKSSATPASVTRALLAQVRVPVGAVPLSRDVTSPAKLVSPTGSRSAAASAGPSTLSTESIDPAPQAGVAREAQAAVYPLPGGDNEVRVDVLAWYPTPGFTRDRMPTNSSYIAVFRDVGPHGPVPGSLVLVRRTAVQEIVRFIKSLHALGATAPVCHAAPGDLFTLESDRSFLAVHARVEPACARVELSVNGEPPDELTWIGAPVSVQAKTGSSP